jgi:hypothetical protein
VVRGERSVGVSVPVSSALVQLSLSVMPATTGDATKILELEWRAEIALEEAFRHRLESGRQALG